MIELRRDRSRVRLSQTVWVLTLDLARVCGWNPSGTRHLRAGGGEMVDDLKDVRHLMGWQTEYISNDGQTVTADDAAHLARALQKAAVDASKILADWRSGTLSVPGDVRTPESGFQWFITPDGRDHLQAVANFCGGGAFQIF
jgi:hypothetical protein